MSDSEHEAAKQPMDVDQRPNKKSETWPCSVRDDFVDDLEDRVQKILEESQETRVDDDMHMYIVQILSLISKSLRVDGIKLDRMQRLACMHSAYVELLEAHVDPSKSAVDLFKLNIDQFDTDVRLFDGRPDEESDLKLVFRTSFFMLLREIIDINGDNEDGYGQDSTLKLDHVYKYIDARHQAKTRNPNPPGGGKKRGRKPKKKSKGDDDRDDHHAEGSGESDNDTEKVQGDEHKDDEKSGVESDDERKEAKKRRHEEGSKAAHDDRKKPRKDKEGAKKHRKHRD